MQDLTVALIQSALHWHQIEANLAMFEEKIWQLDQKVDLIVLPEMFTTGFTMEAEKLAEPMGGKTFKWLRQQAAQSGAVMVGSYIVKENGHFFNRLLWVAPDGTSSQYDKRHLFRMAGEHEHFAAGDNVLVTELKGWKICPLVCYDLRFPAWSRNQPQEGGELEYDLLLYVANWPAARINAWDILLPARAIENLSYCIGLNRVAADGLGVEYCGHSAAVDFKGDTLTNLMGEEKIEVVSLSRQQLADYRKKFPAHLDADRIELPFGPEKLAD